MPSKSKTKGNNFELDMVKKLNTMYNTEEFARVPNSGAFMGQSNWGKRAGLSDEVKRTLTSDLIVANFFKFSVECKAYKDSPNYATMIKGPDADLDRWLGETIYDALNINLIPLLFFKTNNKGTHCVLPQTFMLQLDGCKYYSTYGDFIIISLEHFTNNCDNISRYGNLFFDATMSWLADSEHSKNLLEQLKETKKKGKK